MINTAVANATVTALMNKHPYVVHQADVGSSCWSKSFFIRMNFVKRKKASSKVGILGGTRKKIEFLLLHEILSKVEKFDISTALTINIGQASSCSKCRAFRDDRRKCRQTVYNENICHFISRSLSSDATNLW